MSDADPEFVAIGPVEPCIGDLPGDLTAQPGPRYTEQRSWLDTPDWRLQRAGLVLAHTVTAGAAALELQLADGRLLTHPDPGVSWPALLDALPAGELRAALAPVIEIRALLSIVTVHSTLQRISILNADRKTVSRIVIEHSTVAGGGELPTRLRLSAVRGYQGPTERVQRALATTDLQPSGDSGYAMAVAAIGRHFRDDEITPAPMPASKPAAEAVLDVLHSYRRTVEANLVGVIDDVDTEFLHDLRVAVRRARSTVKLTGDVLPAAQSARLGAELKWLGDLTSPTRDLDVYLLGLPAMAQSLRSAVSADLQPFRAHLRRRRRTEWRRLVRGLQSRRFDELMSLWAGLSTQDSPRKRLPVQALAAHRIGRAHKKVITMGSAVAADSPAERLHDLRKRCKELRYLLEMFRPLHPKTTHRAALQSLKALQECLGDFQDSEVQGLAVRSFATQMLATHSAPAATVLAMGELTAQLAAQQHAARERFAITFADFAGKVNQRRFAELSTVDTG